MTVPGGRVFSESRGSTFSRYAGGVTFFREIDTVSVKTGAVQRHPVEIHFILEIGRGVLRGDEGFGVASGVQAAFQNGDDAIEL